MKTQSKGKKKSPTKREGAAKSLNPRATMMPEAWPDLLRDLLPSMKQAQGIVAQAINSMVRISDVTFGLQKSE